jgi:hypothetical protein
MTATAEKVRENRLRAAAERQGYRLVKSRRRDPRATDYGGYMIVDLHHNYAEAAGMGDGFQMTIDDVEKWLTDGPERA